MQGDGCEVRLAITEVRRPAAQKRHVRANALPPARAPNLHDHHFHDEAKKPERNERGKRKFSFL